MFGSQRTRHWKSTPSAMCSNSIFSSAALSALVTPLMRSVNPALTYSAVRPVSGWVRAIGCTLVGYSRVSLLLYTPRHGRSPAWIASRPQSSVWIGADNASQALYIEAKAVSPPAEGVTSIRSIEIPGGCRSHETSVCQPSPAAKREFASAWMRSASGWWSSA